MHILIDTNIVISLEPTSPDHLEPRTALAASFVRVVSEGGHRLLLHPASLQELAGDKDPIRREIRDVLLGKYLRLAPEPPMAQIVRDELGEVAANSHHHVDHLMLSAVVTNSVQFLVTDDGGIIKKASRLGIEDRVFTVEDALALLQSLLGRTPEPPPLVEATKSYRLDPADTIFDSFREDYEGFNEWLAQCQLEHRPAWVIRDEASLAAVCIVKESDDELSLGGPTLKVCSLKVSEQRAGRRYGELRAHLETVYPALNSLLFTAPKGGPLHIANFRQRVWWPALDATGLPHSTRIHDLRHTCASLLIRQGVHPKAIQHHLGHSSINITMDRYGHLLPDQFDDLASRLDLVHANAASESPPGSPAAP